MTAFDRLFHQNIFTGLITLSARPIGTALVIGIVLGLGVLFGGPVVVLGGIVGLIAFVVAFTNPELVILGLLSLVSGLFPQSFNPSIGLGIAHLQVADLLLIMLLSVAIVRLLVDKAFRYVKTPLDLPLLLFSGTVIIGMATAILNHGITFSDTTYEARIFLYYLVFFAVTNLIRTRSQLVRLIQGILVVAVLSAGTMVAQAFLGRSFLLMDPTALHNVRGEEGLIRFYPLGGIVIYTALILLICDLVMRRDNQYSMIKLLSSFVLALALLVGLSRNDLISATIALVALVITVRKVPLSVVLVKLITGASIALLAAALLVMTGNESRLMQYLSVYSGRLSSMFSERIVSPQDTLVWRLQEAQAAWTQIVASPILGIGLKTPYRPAWSWWDPLTDFIHNAYLWLWLKTGILGLFAFLWFSFCFLVRGFRHWRDAHDSFLETVTLGFTLAYLGMMFSNLVAPSFTQDFNLAIYGVLMGINEVVFRTARKNLNLGREE